MSRVGLKMRPARVDEAITSRKPLNLPILAVSSVRSLTPGKRGLLSSMFEAIADVPNAALVRRPCGMVMVSGGGSLTPRTLQVTSISRGAASRARARTRPSPFCSRSMFTLHGAQRGKPFSASCRLLRGPLSPSKNPSGRSCVNP